MMYFAQIEYARTTELDHLQITGTEKEVENWLNEQYKNLQFSDQPVDFIIHQFIPLPPEATPADYKYLAYSYYHNDKIRFAFYYPNGSEQHIKHVKNNQPKRYFQYFPVEWRITLQGPQEYRKHAMEQYLKEAEGHNEQR